MNVPFTVNEVEATIEKLKCGKAAGLDGLGADLEHLKYAGARDLTEK